MSLAELQEIERTSVIHSYARLPVEFVRGAGARLWDAEGNEYLDFLCGISVTNLGHCHPRVVAAVREQVGQLMHTSNLFYTEPAMRLAERLSQSSLGGKVFFCNSGAEANEAAIKLVRKARPGGDVVVVYGAFHGRTYGALSATPQEAKQAPFVPLVPGFRAVPAELDALREAVDADTAAVLIEPIQGESGVRVLPTELLQAAREACDEHGAALELTDDPALLARVRELGLRLVAGLERLPHVVSVGGRGLMLACELDIAAPALVRRVLLEERLIVNATGPSTLRLLPPLTIGEGELDDALARLTRALEG
jgi:acetylornithine/succinyldiaminopimelate/putrescine aminotransferase